MVHMYTCRSFNHECIAEIIVTTPYNAAKEGLGNTRNQRGDWGESSFAKRKDTGVVKNIPFKTELWEGKLDSGAGHVE